MTNIIKKILTRLRYWFIWAKFMATRTQSYVTFVNLGMILFLFLAKLKDAGVLKFNLEMTPMLIIGTFIILILFGIFEIYLIKGYKDEINIINVETPLHPKLQGIQEKVDWLYNEKIKEIKEKEEKEVANEKKKSKTKEAKQTAETAAIAEAKTNSETIL